MQKIITIVILLLLSSYCFASLESNDWIDNMIRKGKAKNSIFEFIEYKINGMNNHENETVMTRNHHHWCPLYREEWFCNGSHYEKILEQTIRFNDVFALDKVYPNSKFFIEGNLFFTQVVITWICESISNNNDNEVLLWKTIKQNLNHFLIYIPVKNIAILLYEHTLISYTTPQIINQLENIGYIPSKVILSRLTSDNLINISPSRYNDYYTFLKTYELEPDIILANHFIISNDCSSKYHNCFKHSSNNDLELDSYQCTPGPILRDAEELGKLIIYHSYLATNNTILFKPTYQTSAMTSSSNSFKYNSSIEWFINMRKISKEHNLFEFQDKIQSLHDPNHTLHDYRMHNALEYEEVVTRNKHHWCALYRDNYSCVGDRYESILQKTIPLRNEFTIDKLAPNTRIYMEGNSHLAEIVHSWICESNYYIQKQQYNDNKTIKDIFNVYQLLNDSLIGPKTKYFMNHSSSLFIRLPYHNISIFLLDNYDLFNHDTFKTISALKAIGYIPTVINIGRFNFDKPNILHISTISNRYHDYVKAFPSVYVIPISEKLPSGCQADFIDCYDNLINGPHQCLPGPIFRYTEYFAEEMIKYSYHASK